MTARVGNVPMRWSAGVAEQSKKCLPLSVSIIGAQWQRHLETSIDGVGTIFGGMMPKPIPADKREKVKALGNRQCQTGFRLIS